MAKKNMTARQFAHFLFLRARHGMGTVVNSLVASKRKPTAERRRLVRKLVAEGCNGHSIAGRLHMTESQLRAAYARDLEIARRSKAAERTAATQLSSKADRERARTLASIESSFRSHWNDEKHGNLLYGGAKTVAEALAWVDSFKRPWDER
jgi:predicted transcriptional regulator